MYKCFEVSAEMDQPTILHNFDMMRHCLHSYCGQYKGVWIHSNMRVIWL